MATNTVNSNTWKKLGQYSTSETISISSINFTELMVVGTGEGGRVPIAIPKAELTSSGQTYFGGGYALSNANVGFYVTASTSQITTGMYVNGVSKTVNVFVYYK